MKKKIFILIIVLSIVTTVYPATRGVVPRADGEGTLGTSAKNWLSAYADSFFTDLITVNPAASPTTDADGELAVDIDGWGTNFDAWEVWNGTASAYLVATTASDIPTNGQVPKWSTGGAITWENDDDSGGATAWSAIGDPSNNGLTTITFDNAELSLLTGDNDAAVSFFTIRNTDADHTGGNMYLLDLDYSADDGDPDADYIRLQDSGGVVFTLEQDGNITAGIWQATAIADAYIPDNITIDLATVATTVTITDNESTAENNPIVFVAGADPDGGNLGLETDGTTHYNPSTGTITATEFVGGGSGVTSVDAITGDSATAFFNAGTIEHERGGIEADISAIADGGMLVGTGVGTMAIRASFMTAGAAGFVKHELGGLEADVSAYSGLVAVAGGATAEIDSKSELEGQIADVADFAEADGDVYTNDHDYGGADLELPQATPAVPNADGEIELDFTDGTMVVQHGSAHAELGAATDVVMGKMPHSFAVTLAMPDGLQSEIDNWPLKAIESTIFPHGIVVTRIRLKTSASSTYAVNIENWDDPTTINGANPTIDAITTSGSTEATEDTITYSTIAAGQIIMMDLPTTDIGWITVEVEYYEPAA